jgi:hypothetical protein
MNPSIFELNLELIAAVAIILVIYLLPRFKYSAPQHILRTPSNLRQGSLSAIASLLIVIYHGHVFSAYPSWFLECSSDQCSVSFFQGIGFLLGYNHPEFLFTEHGNHSRLIFFGITLFSLSISFHFYIRYINENRKMREQLLHLKRKCEVLIVQYENPAYDSKDDFSQIYIDYDLTRLGLHELKFALQNYRQDHSLKNLNLVVEHIKQLQNL